MADEQGSTFYDETVDNRAVCVLGASGARYIGQAINVKSVKGRGVVIYLPVVEAEDLLSAKDRSEVHLVRGRNFKAL